MKNEKRNTLKGKSKKKKKAKTTSKQSSLSKEFKRLIDIMENGEALFSVKKEGTKFTSDIRGDFHAIIVCVATGLGEVCLDNKVPPSEMLRALVDYLGQYLEGTSKE